MSETVEWSFTHCHAFERDLLYAVRTLEDDEPPKGLTIKAHLEADYGETVNHSRLYQNLDNLVERGLLTKGEKDARTNEYETTGAAKRMLEQRAELYAEAVGLSAGGDGA